MTTSEAMKAVLALSRHAFDQGVYAATAGSEDPKTVEHRDAREAAEAALMDFLIHHVGVSQ